jgi:hypothetical protein
MPRGKKALLRRIKTNAIGKKSTATANQNKQIIDFKIKKNKPKPPKPKPLSQTPFLIPNPNPFPNPNPKPKYQSPFPFSTPNHKTKCLVVVLPRSQKPPFNLLSLLLGNRLIMFKAYVCLLLYFWTRVILTAPSCLHRVVL